MSMDIDAQVPIATLPPRQNGYATVLCCNCGAPIDGTIAGDAGALCESCISLTVDISQGIQREATLHTCRDCDRWLSPPAQWLVAAPESRELLALCLRKLKGLHKTRIIDASFIWTEPHSRRIKVKITIQQEAFQGTILQQQFEVEYVVAHYQCPDCAKSYTHNTWRANVQVRQKVPHKRTFLYLEQLILKYNAHKDTINIKEVDSGIDFFFAQRNQAEKFVEFITSVAPVRSKKSQQLISMDIHTSTKSYKFNYSIEIVPLCKDDLVALPLKVAKQAGNINPLTLCYRIGTTVNLLNPHTLQSADISPSMFWREPFHALGDVRQLTEFVVMDIEPLGPTKGRFVLADATIRRASDFGVNDVEYTTRTHLGHLLHPGDSVMGYHLTASNFNNPWFEQIEENNNLSSTIPDVVLVKKVYPRRQKKNKGRNWKLRRLERQKEEEAASGRKAQQKDQEEMDYEMFLRDVEEDQELRSALNVYKAERQQDKRRAKAEKMEGIETQDAVETDGEAGAEEEEEVEDGSDADEDDGLAIPMEELQDEFNEMGLDDADADADADEGNP